MARLTKMRPVRQTKSSGGVNAAWCLQQRRHGVVWRNSCVHFTQTKRDRSRSRRRKLGAGSTLYIIRLSFSCSKATADQRHVPKQYAASRSPKSTVPAMTRLRLACGVKAGPSRIKHETNCRSHSAMPWPMPLADVRLGAR